MSSVVVPATSANTATATPAASDRRWEIDALRGLMLVLMTVTHIPTRFSDPLGQPFGFVSAAEGFVLLSAYVAGKVYTQRQLRDGAEAMRSAFLSRALKIYLCQVALLVFLLAVVALIGVLIRQPAITDMVAFFLDKPLTAFFGGLLLLYNPPLLDILPMYVVFMLISPLVLLFGSRHGRDGVLVVSGLIWLAAQFGLSQVGYDTLVRLTGMPVPFRETGAFEMLAWQFLWMIGLWIGAAEASGQPVHAEPFPRWMVRAALVIAVVHLVWRHLVGHVPFPGHDMLNLAYDKWSLGPMRVVNFLALVLLAIHYAPALASRLPRWPALERLGRQSLPVFCAHLVLAMAVLTGFGGIEPKRPWLLDVLILGSCCAALYAVAFISEAIDRQAQRQLTAQRERRRQRSAAASAAPPSSPSARPVAGPDAPKSPRAKAHSPPG
jgi:hypothetical protein